ncbi:hypothetical protein LCGC14_1230920 [marine sediment metagenome]|uniref:Uroporphyrinogen decarboxylase (URO-D) domain-containing protein n=1 Tax=marine sediment metagenome TaxID=412755 RepID=A0A0F9NQS3_9ZZZZ
MVVDMLMVGTLPSFAAFVAKNPQFCIITPTAYLERFAVQSSMHLVLAHLVDADQVYADFYASRKEFKIMDNGAYELGESYDPKKLIELGLKCKADAIVLPDYPFEPASKTVDAATAMIDAVKDAGFKTMFVPQSEKGDVEDWIKGYVWASEMPSIDIIGMSILGIPNALNKIHVGYARVVMTQILIERGIFNFNKYHHYLGLTSGPKLEIPSLIGMGALDSCDSSGPVWAGICARRYSDAHDSLQAIRKVETSVNFDYPLTSNEESILKIIQHNIDMTLELFNAN